MIERQRIQVQGIVQGVGFRPFVYGLASSLELAGFVRNDSHGVTIEIEGTPAALEAFRQALYNGAPPLARIDSIRNEFIGARGDCNFVIIRSESGNERQVLISPDVATCDDCLQELLDPADRRYLYPFINCTNCGPRFTIVQDVPYDRDKTTMRPFAMCPRCQSEYDDPLDRRFHAQPNACPVCGPGVTLVSSKQWAVSSKELVTEGCLGSEPAANGSFKPDELQLTGNDAVGEAARLLSQGKILAIKGLGGYHLACDARNAAAVLRLRQSKRREAKPFALMVANLETARELCFVSPAEAGLLESRRRPIVLLEQRPDSPIAPAVAPGYSTLGVMLPYTPLHVLLLETFAGCLDYDGPAVLVMTSGNASDEPIAYQDGDAQERLATIADGWLSHNRDIQTRCDDSVTRFAAGGEQILRRARGYVPEPITVARPFPRPILACGGHLKNTFCLAKDRHAFISQHIGDLENLETLTAFREGIKHFERLFDIRPEVVAYDLHPDYLATRYALDLEGGDKIGVQHHHAHIASVMAEHGLSQPVIGVAADGTGYGSDGAIWGGEVMIAGLEKFERLGHLAYVPMPGAEQAIRQPWRMAAVYLRQAYGEEFTKLEIPFVERLDRQRWRPLAQMIGRRFNSPLTSSLGRLFDAVAALLGVGEFGAGEVLYEGQAAIELEMLAAPGQEPYPFLIGNQTVMELDVSATIRAIVSDVQEGVPAAVIAGRFHTTVAHLLAAACLRAWDETGIRTVALSGGVFQNRLLLEQLVRLLEAEAFEVFINRQVPPNDGGLSLGQAAVTAARLNSGQ